MLYSCLKLQWELRQLIIIIIIVGGGGGDNDVGDEDGEEGMLLMEVTKVVMVIGDIYGVLE